MKKNKIFNIFLILFVCIMSVGLPLTVEGQLPPPIKGKHYMTIPSGMFLRVVLQQQVSTATNNLGDEVTAILPDNFYMENIICLPHNSILEGKIVELELPKKGRNGLMRIHFSKIVFPEGQEFSFDSDLWHNGRNIVGGEPSKLSAVRQVPFFCGGMRPGYILMKPTGEYLMGKDAIVPCGMEVLARVNNPIYIDYLEE